MAPVHDTDLAEKRWNEAEWGHYELWEKIELRFRRRKQLWISGTVVLFLLISAVPIVRDRMPKWTTLAQSRRLGEEVNQIKLEASRARSPYRIRFESGVEFKVEKLMKCSDLGGVLVRSGNLGLGDSVVLTGAQGADLSIPGLTHQFCFDPLSGSEAASSVAPLLGFGLISSHDLAEKRTDRLSILLLSGASAEAAFE